MVGGKRISLSGRDLRTGTVSRSTAWRTVVGALYANGLIRSSPWLWRFLVLYMITLFCQDRPEYLAERCCRTVNEYIDFRACGNRRESVQQSAGKHGILLTINLFLLLARARAWATLALVDHDMIPASRPRIGRTAKVRDQVLAHIQEMGLWAGRLDSAFPD
jgi:hypothetical protein